MHMKYEVYKNIKQYFIKNAYPPEAGGIIGSSNGVITVFHGDDYATCNDNLYIPDIKTLNVIIEEWSEANITFTGFIHSHNMEFPQLSYHDTIFARNILKANELESVCFLIVTMQNDISIFAYNVYQNEVLIEELILT